MAAGEVKSSHGGFKAINAEGMSLLHGHGLMRSP